MRFDAYHATIPADADEVAGELSRLFYLSEMKPLRGRTNGYERIAGWFHGPEELVRMYWGGNGGGVHVQVQGSESPDVAKRVRIIWPEHGVSRADACEDYHWQGAWEEITATALRIAQEHRLKVTEIKGHGDGDTLYLGSRQSPAFVRIYQKAKEMMGRDADPDHVRVELEVRPGTAGAKRLLAGMQPEELWGVSEWTRKLSGWLGKLPPDRVRLGTVWRSPDVMRTRRWLVTQGLDALTDWADELGSWSELGRAMHALKAELEVMREVSECHV